MLARFMQREKRFIHSEKIAFLVLPLILMPLVFEMILHALHPEWFDLHRDTILIANILYIVLARFTMLDAAVYIFSRSKNHVQPGPDTDRTALSGSDDHHHCLLCGTFQYVRCLFSFSPELAIPAGKFEDDTGTQSRDLYVHLHSDFYDIGFGRLDTSDTACNDRSYLGGYSRCDSGRCLCRHCDLCASE